MTALRMRFHIAVLATTCLLVLPSVILATADDSRPVLTGTVTKVIDADTIDVQLTSGPIRVRFRAIDAPERGQPGGKEATATLETWVLNKQVDLEPSDQSESYGRMVATVYLGDTNINAKLVREGRAWAEPRYMRKADAALCRDEAAARSAKRGLWSLPLDQRVAPWEYRRRKTLKHFTDYSTYTAAECVARIGKR